MQEIEPIDGRERMRAAAAERRAQVVTMFNSGMSQKEIAAATGRTVRQVSTDVYRARRYARAEQERSA